MNWIKKITDTDIIVTLITIVLSGIWSGILYLLGAVDPFLYMFVCPVLGCFTVIFKELAVANYKKDDVNHRNMICSVIGGILSVCLIGLFIL